MFMGRIGWKAFYRWIIGIVITENQAISRPVVIAVFDHVNRRPGDEKFFEVKLGAVKEMDRARDETGRRRTFFVRKGSGCYKRRCCYESL